VTTAAATGKRVGSIVAGIIGVAITYTIVNNAQTWSGIIDVIGKVFENSLSATRGQAPRR
jgi:hypothetical protein